MALIKCPECGKEISDRALDCPNCGCPVSTKPKFEFKITKKVKIIIFSLVGIAIIAFAGALVYNSTPVQNYVAEMVQNKALLKASKTAFKEAEEAEKNNDYELAIKKYKEVIKEDKLYKKAQDKKVELQDTYKNQLLSEVESSMQNQKYTNAIKIIDKLATVVGPSDEFTKLKQKCEGLKISSGEGFDEIATFIVDKGLHHNGVYKIVTTPFSVSGGGSVMNYDGGVVLSYDPGRNIIELSLDKSNYLLSMEINRNKKAEYIYTYNNYIKKTQMKGTFETGVLTDETISLPYYSYEGFSELKKDFNEMATLQIKMCLDEIEMYLIANENMFTLKKYLGFNINDVSID